MATAAVSQDAALQSVFDDLKKELQLRSVADGDLASEHMETGVLVLGACWTSDANLPLVHGHVQPAAQLLPTLSMAVCHN